MLRVTHNAGFFSCCQVRLEAIVDYYNKKGRLPLYIDSSTQYELYSDGQKNPIQRFFQESNVEIPLAPLTWGTWLGEPQFANLHTIRYDQISPLVKRYFTPTPEILQRCEILKSKYGICPSKTCVLFHRGTDKTREVGIPSYEEVCDHADTNQIWLQSEEPEFLKHGKIRFPEAIIIEDENCTTRMGGSVTSNITNHDYAKWFLAIVLLMSECKTVVCGTGNISLWIALFRGNSEGIHQYRRLLPTVYGVAQRPTDSGIWCERI